MCCSGTGRGDRRGGRAASGRRRCGWRVTGPRGPVSRRGAAADWPASTQAREQVHEHLAGLRPGQAGALGALLDWLQGQDGGSWQQRWLASGSDAAGAAWRQLPGGWLNRRSGLAVPVALSAGLGFNHSGLRRHRAPVPGLAGSRRMRARRACPRHVRAARPRRIRPAAGTV